MFNDLREYIKQVAEWGECKVIEGVDWNVELGAISELYIRTPNSPVLIFDKIKGYPPGYRVAMNVIVTPRRTALAMNLNTEAKGIELLKAFRKKTKEMKLIPPVRVKTGPIEENIQTGDKIDLFKFPAPKWHELDGGRYIGTGCMVITKDPDSNWVNLGTYRTMIQDKTTATILIGGHHHGDQIRQKYWAKGQSCPCVITIGEDPLLWSSASHALPIGVSELEWCGGLRNKPVEIIESKVTGLPIPATAEIALEGEIMPPEVDSRQEGPFGEWTGHYASIVRPEPAFRLKRVLHRNDPIIFGNPPYGGFDAYDFDLKGAALIWDELEKQVPNVKGVWMHPAPIPCYIMIVSIKQAYAGHPLQTAMLAAGVRPAARRCSFIIVVDDDINPSNIEEVLWALATRCDPADDIELVRHGQGSLLDPQISPEMKRKGELWRGKALIDACKPFPWKKDFPPSVFSRPALLEKVAKKWKIPYDSQSWRMA